MKRIWLSVPDTGSRELRAAAQSIKSQWVSTVGPNVTAFERLFERLIGLKSLAVNSGTAALHLGLRLLGVGHGDEVICPTFTFVATANPILYLGARPIFLDSEQSTWNLDPNLLAETLKRRAARGRLPRAVVVVHLFGQCADMDPILKVCKEYETPVLEDAAEALGASYKGRLAGAMGQIGIFSFNGNKIITTGGGGMLVSPKPEMVAKARFWATQSRQPGKFYEHCELGYNYRISNILAALGCAQLKVLDRRVKKRRAIAFRYRDAFADMPGLTLMPQARYGLHTNWLSCFLVNETLFGCSRDALVLGLERANIESRPVWKPLHLQPLFKSCDAVGGSVAEELFCQGVCLPSSSNLSADSQLYIVNKIRGLVGAKPRKDFVRN